MLILPLVSSSFMISHSHQCIFVHIPKTAGQSIESVFVELNGLSWINRAPLLLKPNSDVKVGPPRLAHLTASEYLQCGHVTQELFNSYYKFSFVRNPWARLVSEYNYRRKHGDVLYQEPFNKFVLNSFPVPENDDYSNAKDYYRHIIPQWQFLYNKKGQCLVDFIGKFESLQSDFDQVCDSLNLKAISLPHKNQTLSGVTRYKKKLLSFAKLSKSKQHYREYYDDETREFVTQYYAKDIELFGYSFE